jgi:hypothetical protein
MQRLVLEPSMQKKGKKGPHWRKRSFSAIVLTEFNITTA